MIILVILFLINNLQTLHISPMILISIIKLDLAIILYSIRKNYLIIVIFFAFLNVLEID